MNLRHHRATQISATHKKMKKMSKKRFKGLAEKNNFEGKKMLRDLYYKHHTEGNEVDLMRRIHINLRVLFSIFHL